MKGKKSKKKVIILLLVLAIAAVIVYTSLNRPKVDVYTEETVKTRDITTYFSFSGNIEAKDIQEVISKNTLSIQKLYVKEGEPVAEGDLLLELDSNAITLNLEQAKSNINIARINYEKTRTTGKEQQMLQVTTALSNAQLSFDNAEDNLERMRELFEAGSIAKVDLDQAQAALDNALIALESAQKNCGLAEASIDQTIQTAHEQLVQAEASYSLLEEQLDDTKIYAEISGEIDEIYVEEGDSLSMGTKILSIVNYNDPEVTIKVDEYDLAAVAVGEEAIVSVSALGKEVSGTVSDISRQAVVINNVSYFPTTITLESNEELRVGMSVEVRILNHNVESAATISMTALQFDQENKPFVYYRDAEGNAAEKYVTVGVNDGNIVQITEGLAPDETILVPKAGSYTPFYMMEEG
ncbi:MAG TPA: hypothetical protein DD738_03225 [Ruminiclostridium sp.]|nr:hypothetical protein [Ruminiclostridium sp.]